jgi:hypothetical protein
VGWNGRLQNNLRWCGEKMVKWILGIFLTLLLVIGVGGYFFVKDYASDTALSEISNQLAINEDEINQLLDDPEIRKYVESGETPPGNLLFTTKEQAIKLISEKYTLNEFLKVKDKIAAGLDEKGQVAMYKEFQKKFSNDELLALKVVALKEIKKP